MCVQHLLYTTGSLVILRGSGGAVSRPSWRWVPSRRLHDSSEIPDTLRPPKESGHLEEVTMLTAITAK